MGPATLKPTTVTAWLSDDGPQSGQQAVAFEKVPFVYYWNSVDDASIATETGPRIVAA